MTWIRIDDNIGHHPKLVAAGTAASWLWVCGNGYCNKYLTDGFIKASAIKDLGKIANPAKLAEKLVEVGLWDRVDGGFRVHDFHDYNPSAAEVKEKRKKDRDRKRAAAANP